MKKQLDHFGNHLSKFTSFNYLGVFENIFQVYYMYKVMSKTYNHVFAVSIISEPLSHTFNIHIYYIFIRYSS